MPRNILLKILGDNLGAKKAIGETADDLEHLKKAGEGDIEIGVDASQAKREIKEVIAELKLMPKEETIRLRLEGESARLDQNLRRLQVLQNAKANAGDGDTTNVTRQIGNIAGQIDASRGRIEALTNDFHDLTRAEEETASKTDRVASGFDKLVGGALSKIGSTLKEADRSMSKFKGGGMLGSPVGTLGGVFEKLGQVATAGASATAAIVGLGVSLLSLAAGGAILGIIAFAITSLIASLAMALIGVAALAAGFLIALAPIVAFIAAFVYLISQATQGAQNVKAAMGQLAQAVDQQKQAAQSLATAQANASRQRIAALQAEKDAVLALRNAELGATDAKLGVTSALLSLEHAKLALAQFKQSLAGFGLSPGSLEKRAQGVSVGGNLGQQNMGSSATGMLSLLLQYKDLIQAVALAEEGQKRATLNVADAQNNLGKAQATSIGFQKQGLQFYPSYASAISSVAGAQAGLATATARVAAAQSALSTAQDNAPNNMAPLLAIVNKLKDVLTQVFAPGMVGVIQGIGRALDILAAHLKPLEPALKILGYAIGNAFVSFAKIITSPQVIGALQKLIGYSSQMVGPLLKIFGYFFVILLEIANTALPTILSLLKNDIEPWFKKIADHPKSIHTFIDKAIASSKEWFKWIVRLGKGVIAIGQFFTILGIILTPIVLALKIIYDLYNAISEIKRANDAAATSRGVTASAQSGLEAQWLQMLRHPTAAMIKKFGSFANMENYIKTAAKSLGISQAPFAIDGPGVTNVHIHLQQGNTTGDHHHLAAVIKSTLERQGGGARGM